MTTYQIVYVPTETSKKVNASQTLKFEVKANSRKEAIFVAIRLHSARMREIQVFLNGVIQLGDF